MILMLKKLVIIGSLLAVGPMLAGCPGAVFMAVQTVPLVIEAASEIASSTNLNRRSGYPEEARRSADKEDRKFARSSGAARSNQNAIPLSGYPANRSKSELCQIVKYGWPYKEKAKQILRYKGLSCDDEQQRLAEAQRARQAAIEKKKRDDAQRQAKARREAEERRQAEAKRKAEERRKAEQRQQAKAKLEAEKRRLAEAKRKADAAKKSKLYRVGSGSGFSISRDGLIVTNHHVIDGCSAVAITDKGDLHRAVVQSIDERNDLALLKSKLKPRHVFALDPNGTDILREIYVVG